MYKKICKIVIAGDGGTGKTTLINSMKTNCFSYASKITIGVDFACFPVQIKSSPDQEITFLIYDLGGQKRFHFMHSSYIIGSKAAIILYDLNRPKTFENLEYWITILQKENPYMPILIGGAKKDLTQPTDIKYYRKKWQILFQQIENSQYIIDHIVISSKTREGIENIFQKIGQAVLQPEIILKQHNYAKFKNI
ncbi:hypothetical protein NEF87_001513 [Candidatus Lokiarchaeum ossiferum]|uniref:GTP-binding protein n=1 Tax=Candidatus Lokiarchaeum ossiferum TaxID=2951803 RepID=A0ABY6HPG5_9ARCH|nr:hypothetical protein NEF87_001513 [Candidatus Lokiarchaeum sp. B-35]